MSFYLILMLMPRTNRPDQERFAIVPQRENDKQITFFDCPFYSTKSLFFAISSLFLCKICISFCIFKCNPYFITSLCVTVLSKICYTTAVLLVHDLVQISLL
jgi:hypothetical protein